MVRSATDALPACAEVTGVADACRDEDAGGDQSNTQTNRASHRAGLRRSSVGRLAYRRTGKAGCGQPEQAAGSLVEQPGRPAQDANCDEPADRDDRKEVATAPCGGRFTHDRHRDRHDDGRGQRRERSVDAAGARQTDSARCRPLNDDCDQPAGEAGDCRGEQRVESSSVANGGLHGADEHGATACGERSEHDDQTPDRRHGPDGRERAVDRLQQSRAVRGHQEDACGEQATHDQQETDEARHRRRPGRRRSRRRRPRRGRTKGWRSCVFRQIGHEAMLHAGRSAQRQALFIDR